MTCLLLALSIGLAAEPAPAPPKAVRVAVYELKADGIEPEARDVVTQALVLELRKLERVSVISMDEVRAMLDLESQKQLAGCTADSCLAEIADSLGVDVIVIGTLARVGDESVFGLKRLDQKSAAAAGQVTERLKPDDGEEFLAAIGPAVESLFPEHPLRAGMVRGVAPEVARRLNPPPLPPAVFVAMTALGVTAGLATGVLTILNVASAQDLAATTELAKKETYPATEFTAKRERTDLLAVASMVGAGTAVVFGAAAVGTFLLTDWGE